MGEQWGRLKAWVSSHKALAAFVAIGLVLALFLLYRRLKGGSSSAFQASSLDPSQPAPAPGGGSGSGGGNGIDLSPITDAITAGVQADQQGQAAATQAQAGQLSSFLSTLTDSQNKEQGLLSGFLDGFKGMLSAFTAQAALDPSGLDANGNPTGTTHVNTLNESFAAAQGGNPNPGKVAASFSNPAPGGSWGGLSGSDIQAAFIKQAGGNVAQAAANWTTQHNQEVAQNGF